MHDGHRERLRERIEKCGVGALNDHELLEAVLFSCIPRLDTNPVAHDLLDSLGSLRKVVFASAAELMKVHGVGRAVVNFFLLLREGGRRIALQEISRMPLITVGDLTLYAKNLLGGLHSEEFYVIMLDARFNLISTECLAKGVPDQVAIYPRLVLEAALRCNAVNVALAHNHPSGCCLPSVDDIRTTMRVQEALAAVDIKLAEHIIVSDDGVYAIHAQRQSAYKPEPRKRVAEAEELLDPYELAGTIKKLSKEQFKVLIHELE